MPAFLLCLLFTWCLPSVRGHAVLTKPPARNYVAFKQCLGGVDCPSPPPNCPGDGKRQVGCRDYNYCSLQAGGPKAVLERGKKWPSPVGSHGLCGDPVQTRGEVKDWREEPYMYKTPPQTTWNAGDIVEVEVSVCAEHMGMYVFRICDKPLDADNFKTQQAAEDCLNKWALKRAPPSGSGGDRLPIDTKHPERWYIPARGSIYYDLKNETPVAGPDWDSDRDFKPSMTGDGDAESLLQERRVNTPVSSHKMRMIVPEGLSCTHCTLQWWWVSGNNCAYDADYNEYYTRNSLPGKSGKVCDTSFTGEEFWNCADIAVKGKDKPTPPANPSTRRRSAPKPPSTRRRSGGRTTRRRSGPKPPSTRRRSGPKPPSTRRRSGPKPPSARRRKAGKDGPPTTRRRSKPPATRRRSKPPGDDDNDDNDGGGGGGGGGGGAPPTVRRRRCSLCTGPGSPRPPSPPGAGPPPGPPPPYPPGCSPGCKDKNSACGKPNCNWGDYWQDQCQKTCGKCKVCVPAPATPPPPTPAPTPPPPTSRRRKTRRRSAPPPPPSSRRRSEPKPGDDNDNDEPSSRRRKAPTTRRRSKPSGPAPPPARPSDPRYDCKPSSGFKGDVSKYKDGSFCKCDYGGSSSCSFICGGTKPNHGGNCGPAACSEKLVEFDDKNTYIINVKKKEGGAGSPYRAFAYMKNVKVSGTTHMSFTFRAKNHNAVYSKLFFWGDGNNILGIKPPGSAGGASQFCFMPSGDAPLSNIQCKGGTMECKPDTWYRVDMKLSGSNSIALSIDGKSIGTGSIQGFTGMPMIGVYHWAGGQNGGTPEDYQLFFRDMCLGESKLKGR